MDITFTLYEEDLHEALRDFLSKKGQDVNDKDMDVAFKAGRGVESASATITLSPKAPGQASSVTKTKLVEDADTPAPRKKAAEPVKPQEPEAEKPEAKPAKVKAEPEVSKEPVTEPEGTVADQIKEEQENLPFDPDPEVTEDETDEPPKKSLFAQRPKKPSVSDTPAAGNPLFKKSS